jgi:uncharacterized protein (DUF983 family)
MTGDSHVKDIHGNNAAVICPACGQAYVFSGFLDKGLGRVCPHPGCGKSKATVMDKHVTVAS